MATALAPDLIVLDIMLPAIDRYEVLATLRSRGIDSDEEDPALPRHILTVWKAATDFASVDGRRSTLSRGFWCAAPVAKKSR